MKHLLFSVILLGILLLTACSKTTLSAGGSSVSSSMGITSVATRDSLPNNGMCVTLRMRDATQQLVYFRIHPTVKQDPKQTVVSTPLTTITYDGYDVVRQQPGKALLGGTSTAGLPPSVLAAGSMNEQILFFDLPKGSHLNIRTDSGLQWRDQDIEGNTYALVLTELPRGKYIITMNATTFRVELK